jgi:uncharacterized protein (DUF2236 family)
MSPIQIASPYEPVEVDLWGEVYRTVRITRSVEKTLDKIRAETEKAETTDQAVKGFAKLIATYLGDDKVVQVIDAKWKADEITVTELTDFVAAVVEADRPT